MIAGQPLACFQPFIDTATGRIAGVEALGRLRQSDGQLLSVGPLFSDPKTPATALRQLDRESRGDALQRLPPSPTPGVMLLNPPYGERIAAAGVAGQRAATRARETAQFAEGGEHTDFFAQLATHWK